MFLITIGGQFNHRGWNNQKGSWGSGGEGREQGQVWEGGRSWTEKLGKSN